MSNKLEWKDNETNTERLRQVYNFVDWLMFEMQDGTVPNMNVPLSIAFVKMAEKGDIDEITASEHADMFLAWRPGAQYKANTLLQHQCLLYRVLQDHTSQDDWMPDTTPALYKVLGVSENGIPYWSQPISSVDVYMLNSEVINPDDDLIWVSDYDNNVWKPGEFGWHVKEANE